LFYNESGVRLPTVLAKGETLKAIGFLLGVHKLMIKLLYGTVVARWIDRQASEFGSLAPSPTPCRYTVSCSESESRSKQPITTRIAPD